MIRNCSPTSGPRSWATESSPATALVSPDILFIRVSEPKTTKNRLHFDVCPTDRGQEDELARLLDVGARRSNIVGSGSWVVLEDPEGNEFCLMSKQIPAEPAPFHEA